MVEISELMASEIAKIINGQLYGSDISINKISINSKEKMDENTCFWGIKGKRFNGNDYVLEAQNRNVGLVVCDKKMNQGRYIYVSNTHRALEMLAKSRIKSTKIIAVTGSVAKTTVKNMIISVLKQKYLVCGTEGNQNNEIGVLLTLLKIKNEDFCVVEMGMRNIGEIDYLASITHPETVVITNALSSHIETLKSEQNIFLAKCEILNYSPQNAVLPFEKRFLELRLGNIISYFVGEGSNYKTGKFKHINNAIEYEIMDNNSRIKMKIYSIFSHNIHNSLFAYVVGKIYNLSDKDIREGLLQFKQEKMREEFDNVNGITVINDCYNASYESMISALNSLKSYCLNNGKNACALLGDMLELGEKSELYHQNLAKHCKKLGISKLFYKGKNFDLIKKYNDNAIFIDDVTCSEKIKSQIDNNDVLLLKASRAIGLERILEELKREKNE